MHSTRWRIRGVVALLTITVSFTTAHAGAAPFAPVPLPKGTVAYEGAIAHVGEGPFAQVPLQAGIDAYSAGQPVRALTVFVGAAQARPQSAQPVIWAGIAATAAGRMDDAGVYFREGLRRPHTDFQERIIRGWLQRLRVFQEAAAGPKAPNATPKAIAALAQTANPRLSQAQAMWIGEHVDAAARSQGLDPWLLAAVVYIESRFNRSARSWSGALGLGQLMPGTARAAGVNPKDPWGNLLGAAITLRGCYLTFRDWSLALAAYNAGERAVRRFGGIPPYAETRWYVKAVWAIYRQFRPG